MKYTGNYGLFYAGKASSHNTALVSFKIYIKKPPLCAVFSCFYSTGCEAYSFTTDEYGIFTMCTNVGVCSTHEKGSSPNKSAQELTWDGQKKNLCSSPHPSPLCRGSNPGSSGIWIPNLGITTELRRRHNTSLSQGWTCSEEETPGVIIITVIWKVGEDTES